MQAELGRLVLKRFLLFALLLDRVVVQAGLPAGMPLLFRKQASIKTSHEVLHCLPKCCPLMSSNAMHPMPPL